VLHYALTLSIGVTHVERFEHGGAALTVEALGPPGDRHIVFLHGWGGSRESLRGIATLFQHQYRVHLVDLPGFGEAPPPPEGWGTLEYTDLVQRYVLDRLSGWVALVGHSFGGRLSVRLGARRLLQVRAIVLMGVPGLPQPAYSRRKLRRDAIRVLRKTLIAMRPITGQRAIDWHTRRFGSKDYQAAGALRPVLVKTVTEDLTESARLVACPVLLLWGSDDAETPTWLGERYRELMPGRAALEVLPHKDHHLFTGTGAHLCAFRIRRWLEAQDGR
jgi:pimeloyl-ACP methyl ester carboxylesterase